MCRRGTISTIAIGVVLYVFLSAALLLDRVGTCHAFTSHPHYWRRVIGRREVRSLVPVYSAATDNSNQGRAQAAEDSSSTDVETIYELTEKAIRYRGEPEGLHALDCLGEKCARRLPYRFAPPSTPRPKQGEVPDMFLSIAKFLDQAETEASASYPPWAREICRYFRSLVPVDSPTTEIRDQRHARVAEEDSSGGQDVISHLPGLLPKEITAQVYALVKALEEKGQMSTKPDSVDGLPSFHLNLVSDGKPVFAAEEGDGVGEKDEFYQSMNDLLALVRPCIYDELLPKVNQMMNTTSIRVSDVFLRRYGQDLIDDKSRKGISAHYDVFSKVTSVIALDDIAVEGRNGLFTTQVSPIDGKTSNHAALRRFFPLACGDAVVHTWDVLHGVDVEPGLDRTSLIVWFTTEEELDPEQLISPSPWLHSQPDLETNDVAQFVLASSIESSGASFSGSPSKAMLRASNTNEDQAVSTRHPFDLYLESAARENAFALTRFGSLCEDGILDERMTQRAKNLASKLRSDSNLPAALLRDDDLPSMGLAKRFWFEGSIRGNLLAQMALADEIMFEASERDDADARLLSATLFGLAAQQGDERAVDCLRKVVAMDIIASDSVDFLKAPIVQIAATACSRLPVR